MPASCNVHITCPVMLILPTKCSYGYIYTNKNLFGQSQTTVASTGDVHAVALRKMAHGRCTVHDIRLKQGVCTAKGTKWYK